MPVLTDIDDKIVQSHYISVVATKLNVSESAVEEQILGTKTNTAGILPAKPLVQEEKNRRTLLEERLLSLLFTLNPKKIFEEKIYDAITTPFASRILSEAKKIGEEKINLPDFIKSLPKELEKGFSEIILSESEEPNQEELDLVLSELLGLDLKKRLEVLGAKIRKYEAIGEEDKLKKAQEEFSFFTKKLSDLEHNGKKGIILH